MHLVIRKVLVVIQLPRTSETNLSKLGEAWREYVSNRTIRSVVKVKIEGEGKGSCSGVPTHPRLGPCDIGSTLLLHLNPPMSPPPDLFRWLPRLAELTLLLETILSVLKVTGKGERGTLTLPSL